MLRTKCILRPKSDLDGIRISVMSRHTLNDGVTPHPKIDSSSYDEWFVSLAPSDKLLGDYYKRGLEWIDFERRYLEELKDLSSEEEIEYLINRALRVDITLLCVEDSPEFCHRRLLAEECQRRNSGLEIYVA